MSGISADVTAISPLDTARWYFRLNGCFQIEDFVLHPGLDSEPSHNQARTSAQLVGVRMPWRNEQGMEDDPVLIEGCEGNTLVFVARISPRSRCELNQKLTNPALGNLKELLSAVGCVPHADLDLACERICTTSRYQGSGTVVRLIAIGQEKNPVYNNAKPDLLQITWRELLRFVHQRFSAHWDRKVNHDKWPPTGQELWDASSNPDPDLFVETVMGRFPGLHS